MSLATQPYNGSKRLICLLLLCCACSVLFTCRTHMKINGMNLWFESISNASVSSIGDFTDDSFMKNIKNGKPTDERKDDVHGKVADAWSSGDVPQVLTRGNEDGEQEIGKMDEEEPSTNDRRRMNVLLLYPDDWRHNSLGSENPILQTPFLDSLAQEGIRFRQNAVTTSICWQSRATLFSGQWASRHRSFKLKCPHFTKGENWNHTWAGMLQNDGYYTGHVGKWQYHNSDLKKRFDYSHGFEGRHWYTLNRKPISGEDLARHSAVKFLEDRPKDKPFSLSIAFYPPKPVGSSRDPVSISNDFTLI